MIVVIIILLSIPGALVALKIDSKYNQYKLSKLIGQDLSSYSREELQELGERYDRYSYNVGLLYDSRIIAFHDEYERIMDEIIMRQSSFYKLFKERFPYEISAQESDFIQNHILSEAEINDIENETLNLLTQGFTFIRLFSSKECGYEDNSITSSIADYLHNIPGTLGKIKSTHKWNSCFIEFIKRFNSCCSEILKTEFPDKYKPNATLYLSSFCDMKNITDNILSVMTEEK